MYMVVSKFGISYIADYQIAKIMCLAGWQYSAIVWLSVSGKWAYETINIEPVYVE